MFLREVHVKENKIKEKGEILKQNDVDFSFPSQKSQLLSNDFSKFNKL